MTADRSEFDLSAPADVEATASTKFEGLTLDAARADMAVTGILLVGGASSRFGSPKALAELRGETLAERAWRTLGEACGERIAIGKESDGLELPFPLLDDGSEDRAPIHGLLAGLRAASNDVCLVLPVDCPLVTAEALRELGDARAIPQTGPLPGAYERAHIEELERRLAQGDLSLRGVNPNVLELDHTLLLNVNTRSDLVAAAIADWAAERDDVHAAVVVGSRARTVEPADRWSDLDVFLVVDKTEPYLADGSWVAEFGRPLLTFVEPTAVGHERERRVLYDSGEDVDLPLVPVAALDLLESPEVAPLVARGYRVLVDKIGLEQRLRAASAHAPIATAPTLAELTELASDFWYHALWSAKKLRRGEVFISKQCIDGYLKARLVTLLQWHAWAVDPAAEVWHAGRFLERWADPGALAALEDAYARYDVRDVARALWATIDLWETLEAETASRLGLTVELEHSELRARIAEVVPDARVRL
jgi:molybdopterin-guanine dinucleotide biosynthesis protein A/predicted nucleotidyltransferase